MRILVRKRIAESILAILCLSTLTLAVPFQASAQVTVSALFSDLEQIGTHNGFLYFTSPSANGQGLINLTAYYNIQGGAIGIIVSVTNESTLDSMDTIFLSIDFDHDRGETLQEDDWTFAINRAGQSWDWRGNYSDESLAEDYPGWFVFYLSNNQGWLASFVFPAEMADNQEVSFFVQQIDWSATEPPYNQDQAFANFPSESHPRVPNTWGHIIFLKRESTINLSAFPSEMTYGETTSLVATINKNVSNGTITIEYSKDGGVWNEITSGAPSEGRLSYTWSPPTAESYSLRALWTGDMLYRSSTSITETATVQRAASSTSASLTDSTIEYMENLTITSVITPALSEGLVYTEYSQDKINWTQIDSSPPSEGTHSIAWTPPSAGTFYIRTRWSGTDNYKNSTSQEQTLIVNKIPTSLHISVAPEAVQIDPLTHSGATIHVSGSITPILAEVEVAITYTQPDGSTRTVITTTNSAGEFTDSHPPNQPGTWSIGASWEGNINYLGSSSSTVTLSVSENWIPYIALVAIIAVVVVVILLRIRKK